MTVTVRLPALMIAWPDHWKNFARNFDSWEPMFEALVLNYKVKPFNVPKTGPEYLEDLIIEFEHASDYTMFILKNLS